jgi:trans-L-3-hydroxyproline dehydratase
MYGAVLRHKTELTERGEADIGVLFLTNEGYSTMCGHATIALGKFLVDYIGSRSHDLFDASRFLQLKPESDAEEIVIRLHVPCGLVRVTVPIIVDEYGRWQTDPEERISYISVPSFATGMDVKVKVSEDAHSIYRWKQLEDRNMVTVDVAYGGAFYIVVSAKELGFSPRAPALDSKESLVELRTAADCLRRAFETDSVNEDLKREGLSHPSIPEMEELYGVIVTGRTDNTQRADEVGLCFFADQQVDRSPTGSGVQARVALAHAKGQIELDDPLDFESPISDAFLSGTFRGEAVEEVDFGNGRRGVIVRVSGSASYTGCSTFVVDEEDKIGCGFDFQRVWDER